MATEIRSKDYSFPEAFNAVGKKLVPGWTGDEIDARECHSPEDVDVGIKKNGPTILAARLSMLIN